MTVTALSPSSTPTYVTFSPTEGISKLANAWGLLVTETDVPVTQGAPGTAPKLRLPADLPPQLMLQVIVGLAQKLAVAEGSNRVEMIQMNEARATERRETIIKKMLEAIDNAAAAMKAAKEKAIVDWILIGLGLLLSVVAVIATAGALAPALATVVGAAVGGAAAGAAAGGAAAVGIGTQVAAVAAMTAAAAGAAMATLEFVNAVIKEAGGATSTDINGRSVAVDVSILGLVKSCMALAIAAGDVVVVDEQGRYLNRHGEVDASIKPKAGAVIKTQAELDKMTGEIAMGLSIAISVAMIAGGVGGSARAMVGIERAATRAAATAERTSGFSTLIHALDSVAAGLETVASLGQGAVQIGSSVLELKFALSVLSQSLAKADKALEEAELEVIMQEMNLDRDAVSRTIQQFDQAIQMFSAMLQQMSQSMSTVARNTTITTAA